MEVARHTATVVDIRPLARKTVSIDLEVDGGFRYAEGQYIRIELADGRRRDLSISNPSDGSGRVELWMRDAGGDFSRYVFDELEPGARWTFEGPLGDARVQSRERPLLLVAGGTGLGPARAIALAELTRDRDRRIELIYGEPDREALIEAGELAALEAEHAGFRLAIALERPEGGWSGRVGTPEVIAAEECGDLGAWDAHLFGPPKMVEALVPVLRARGLEADRIYADAFTPGASDLDRSYPPSR